MPAVAPGAVVAVTGANGFIGSHVCKKLLEDGYSVRAVVRDPSDAAKVDHLLQLPGADARLQCVRGDLLKPGDTMTPSRVVLRWHTAAVVEVLDNRDAENKIVKPAVDGTKNTIASARKAGIQRLVMTSSVAAVQSPWGLPDSHTYAESDWNGWSTVESDPRLRKGSAGASPLGCVGRVGGSNSDDGCGRCSPSVTLGPALTKAHTKSRPCSCERCCSETG